jgi:hypothetical protein
MSPRYASFAFLALKRRMELSSEPSWAHYLPSLCSDKAHVKWCKDKQAQDPSGTAPTAALDALQVLSLSREEMRALCRDEQGNRHIQRAIESAESEDERLIITGQLQGHVIELSQCPYGNFVLQQAIQCTRPFNYQFILDEITSISSSDFLCVTNNRYGCRVIQRLLEFAHPAQLEPLVNRILESTSEIACDPFGKFVITHLLSHGLVDSGSMDAVVRLSQDVSLTSHGRHVLGVAFDMGSADDRETIVSRVKKDIGGLARMAHCRYGHALLIRVLTSLSEPERSDTWEDIKSNAPKLGQSRYGKLVLRHVSSLNLDPSPTLQSK